MSRQAKASTITPLLINDSFLQKVTLFATFFYYCPLNQIVYKQKLGLISFAETSPFLLFCCRETKQ